MGLLFINERVGDLSSIENRSGDVPVSRYRIDRDSDTIAKRLRRSGSIDRILGQDSKSEQLARGLREDQVEIRNSG
jgi:hypothetical protein